MKTQVIGKLKLKTINNNNKGRNKSVHKLDIESISKESKEMKETKEIEESPKNIKLDITKSNDTLKYRKINKPIKIQAMEKLMKSNDENELPKGNLHLKYDFKNNLNKIKVSIFKNSENEKNQLKLNISNLSNDKKKFINKDKTNYNESPSKEKDKSFLPNIKPVQSTKNSLMSSKKGQLPPLKMNEINLKNIKKTFITPKAFNTMNLEKIESKEHTNINLNKRNSKQDIIDKEKMEKKKSSCTNKYNISYINTKSLNIYTASIAGKTYLNKEKVNQDSFLVLTPNDFEFINLKGINELSIFGVFDGHGEYGHLVSGSISNSIKTYFTNIQNYEYYLERNYTAGEMFFSNNFHFIKNSVDFAVNKLREEKYHISKDSGSTLLIIITIGISVISINVGDTKSVIYNLKQTGAGFKVNDHQLSFDHKPEDPTERDRIIRCNGEVIRSSDGVQHGPYRVYSKGNDYPGLAMSRSIGDFDYYNIGIINDPYVSEFKRNKENRFLVLASDGLWDFFENLEVGNLISKSFTPSSNNNKNFHKIDTSKLELGSTIPCNSANVSNKDLVFAIERIIEENSSRWEKDSSSRDDTTIILVFFNN